ncbi:MAG: hypothetical protein UIH41_04315 [Treponemataceae bacterium]|nr:hypothetical protein [Treponemataceae bacterium]
MKKNILLCLLILITSLLFCNTEDSQLVDFQRKFHKGNLQDKVNVINEAALIENLNKEIFTTAMNFVRDYTDLLKDDSTMLILVELTIENVNRVPEPEAVKYLLEVFSSFNSKDIKNLVMKSVISNKYNNKELNSLIENYGISLLEKDNADDESLFLLINAMGKLQNPDFFNLLFRIATSEQVSDIIKTNAELAISSIETNYKTNMLSVIENGTVLEKKLALKLVLENEKNSDFLRAEVAEKSLQVSIIITGDTLTKDLIDFQMTALKELRRVAWTRSSDLIIKFFNNARKNYEDGILSEKDYIEIVETTAELASTKASSLLSEYLAYFNEQTEQGISCSEPLVLSVINALGTLGNKLAFDNLLYVGYLSYSEEIIEASRAALAGLKF